MVEVNVPDGRRRSTSRRAGATTTLFALVNVAIGLVYQAVLAAYLGLTAAADSFQYAYTIITFGCVVVMAMAPSVLVPRMAARRGRAYSFADCCYPVGAGAAFTGIFIGLSRMGFVDPNAATTLGWGALSCIFAGVASAGQAIALLERRFALAGAGAVVNGCVGVAALTLVLTPASDPRAYGLVIVAGYAAQAVASCVGLAAAGVRLYLHPTLVFRAFLGYLLFTVVAKFQPVLERIIAASIDAVGATAALGLGQKVAQGILLVASFGLSFTAIPALSALLRAQNTTSAAKLVSKVATATIVSTSVVLAFALPLSYPAIAILFERKSFSADEAHQVQQVLLLQFPWVAASALATVGTSILYVLGWYARVLISAACGLIATCLSAVPLAAWSPSLAVAAASSIGAIASLIVTTHLVMRSSVGPETFWRVKEHIGLSLSALGVLTVTSIAYAGSAAIAGVDSVLCIAGTICVAVLATTAMMFRPRTREQMRDVFNAEI